MLLARNSKLSGVRFAWLPKWTPDGLVWLEFVRRYWNDHEFGGWYYERLKPQEVWDHGA